MTLDERIDKLKEHRMSVGQKLEERRRRQEQAERLRYELAYALKKRLDGLVGLPLHSYAPGYFQTLCTLRLDGPDRNYSLLLRLPPTSEALVEYVALCEAREESEGGPTAYFRALDGEGNPLEVVLDLEDATAHALSLLESRLHHGD